MPRAGARRKITPGKREGDQERERERRVMERVKVEAVEVKESCWVFERRARTWPDVEPVQGSVRQSFLSSLPGD